MESRPRSTSAGPRARSRGRSDVPGADVAAVSPSGEVAVILKADFDTAFTRSGTLARVSATGGAPRELLENVEYADWSPDGKDLAIVRIKNGKCRLEFPTGKVLYETTRLDRQSPGLARRRVGSRSWIIPPSTTTADPSP